MSLFFKDSIIHKEITWEDLINDLKNTNTYNPYCISADYYTVFKHFILSLVINEPIILLDAELTNDEIKYYTGEINLSQFNQPLHTNSLSGISTKQELIDVLLISKEKWSITLFTSGTTGIPKKITHTFSSITRFVQRSNKHQDNIWGFAYHPTHMAGVQVFLQALLNGNFLVRLFGIPVPEIYKCIEEIGITHISATPTFYRLLLPVNKVFPSVRRITSGGEKFDENTMQQIRKVFPNAKINNVYALTEAGTLFASNNNIFTVKHEFKHLVTSANDQLLIHHSLMGSSAINDQEWYHTGDLIEIIQHEPLTFKIIARNSEMINVGGYKVNPTEVEEALLSLTGIKQAFVYGKKNSVLGNIVCCKIVLTDLNLTEQAIRTYLQEKLQEFKIPRIFSFVTSLDTTRTGKIKRVQI